MQEQKRNILRIAVSALVLLLIPLAVLLARRGGTDAAAVRLNEILASNSVYPDPYGKFRDFVELYNGGETDLDISGWGLTDSGRTVKYRFPEGTLVPAGAYLVVWCDASAPPETGCAPFSVSKAGGETVSLLNARNLVVDSVETPALDSNRPLVPDAAGNWYMADFATPGYPNDETGYEAWLASREEAAPEVVITELMSRNTLHRAPSGDCPDWIELYNAGDSALSLAGFRLSDAEDREKYIFPAGETLGPGEYRVLWCGGETGFSLRGSGGETLVLTDRLGGIADRLETPPLAQNRSWALQVDGTWAETDRPTPGYPNDDDGYYAYLEALGYADCPAQISEAMPDNRGCIPDAGGRFSDWIELYNDSGEALDLTGFWLSTDPAEPAGWAIPALTLPPYGCALLFCDGENRISDGELHTDFRLSRSGETVLLSTPVGSPVSELRFGALEPDRSAAATGETDLATPGFPNTPTGALAFLESREIPAGLAINEVMTANDAYLRQSGGQYYDWVELKNCSDTPITLSDYTLTDNSATPELYRLPEKVLEPGKTVVILLTGEEGRFQQPAAPFALRAEEDWLYLYGPGGTLADYIHVTGHPYRGSVGRMEGERGWFYFSQATPEQENRDGYREIAPAPETDTPPGIYEGVEELTLTLSGPGEIRYTTDGSVPTRYSKRYEEPLTLKKTGVIRAKCFPEDMLPGETVTWNYVINEGHSLPVVCLSLAPGDFDGGGGIYANPESYFEVDANVAFFAENEEGFCLDCGVKLHGAGSRKAYPKKSMRLGFRPRSGGLLNYDVFGDGAITCFKSLLLRGGSCLNGNILVKDTLAARLANAASDHVLALNERYAVLYVNGAYWGVYCIREDYSERYVADHLGVPEEDIYISHAPVIPMQATQELHDNMFRASRMAAGEDGCAWAESWLDLENLTDWMIFEAYFTNCDIPGNVRYIYTGADGKWRYALYDLDESLYHHDPSWEILLEPGNQHSMIPRAMLNNPEFRDRFLRRLSELLSGPLSDGEVEQTMTALFAELEPEIPRETERWGGEAAWTATTRNFLASVRDGRGEKVARGIAKFLRITEEEFAEYFPFYGH